MNKFSEDNIMMIVIFTGFMFVMGVLILAFKSEVTEVNRQCRLLYSIAKTPQDSLIIQVANRRCKPTE